MAAAYELDLVRALERRAEALSMLVALDVERLGCLQPAVAAEVLGSLAEAHGVLKAASRLAGVRPVAAPSSDGWQPAAP